MFFHLCKMLLKKSKTYFSFTIINNNFVHFCNKGLNLLLRGGYTQMEGNKEAETLELLYFEHKKLPRIKTEFDLFYTLDPK